MVPKAGRRNFVRMEWENLWDFLLLKKTPFSPEQTLIAQIFPENTEQAEKWCDTAEEVLEYPIDGDRLREIITKVDEIDRTI